MSTENCAKKAFLTKMNHMYHLTTFELQVADVRCKQNSWKVTSVDLTSCPLKTGKNGNDHVFITSSLSTSKRD